MRIVIVYESTYGNTHTVAERIAEGFEAALREPGCATVVPTDRATPRLVAGADLLVVGGPTHMHGMSWSFSRRMGREGAVKDDSDLELDPDAESPGLRTWFHGLRKGHHTAAAAFDTRLDAPPGRTGRASIGIARRLHHHGFRLVTEPESFLVDERQHLAQGEEARARTWGGQLAEAVRVTT